MKKYKSKHVTPYSSKLQTTNYLGKNRKMLGIILSYYLIGIISLISYVLVFSKTMANTFMFDENPFIPSINIISSSMSVVLLWVILIISYCLQTFIYETLLDFIRNSEKFRNYSFIDFAIEPFKRIKLKTIVRTVILNILKMIILGIISFIFVLIYGFVSTILFNISFSEIIAIINLLFGILMVLSYYYISITFSQLNISIADAELSNSDRGSLSIFSFSTKVLVEHVGNYIFFILNILKWFIIIPIIHAVAMNFMTPVGITYTSMIFVIIMIIMAHYYIPLLSLGQVTYYDELLQSKDMKI